MNFIPQINPDFDFMWTIQTFDSSFPQQFWGESEDRKKEIPMR